ncbi:hypothetical protein D3C71_1876880 [compost metagenome]
MHGLAVVAGAQQGQVGRAPAQGPGAARLHERQRLEGLDGGAREHHHLWVAHLGQHLARAVGHGHGTPVLALDQATPGDFDQRYETHVYPLRAQGCSVRL